MANPERLYILAFDHRNNFRAGWFGLDGPGTAADVERVGDAKAVVFEGLELAARRSSVPAGCFGGLIDEEIGAVARVPQRMREAGLVVTMPVERSGTAEFEFEHGDAFGEHLERIDPDYAKVLVKYNVDGDAAVNDRQAQRLARLSRWLREHDRKLLFELLVPAEPAQLADSGDQARFETEQRPELIRRGIVALQEAGVEPEIWKLEGMPTRSDHERVVALARADGRDAVDCVVLGAGGDVATVDAWLRTAASVDGFTGFAIGRSIWGDPLHDLLAGRCDRAAAAGRIAERFEGFVAVYEEGLATRRVAAGT